MNQEDVMVASNAAAEQEKIRKASKDGNKTLAKEVAYGMLTGENIWTKWIAALGNQRGMILRVTGVPLLYIIREAEAPDDGATYPTVEETCIAKRQPTVQQRWCIKLL